MADQTLTKAMNKCIFCQIAASESPATKEFEDDDVIVIHSIKPSAPLHLLVIPKKHITALTAVTAQDAPLLGKMLVVANNVATQMGFADLGYKLAMNVGVGGGQVVPHIHLHVLGKKSASDSLESRVK